MRHTLDAHYGVTVTAPDTLDADTDITIAGANPTPAVGRTICRPASEALVTEAGDHPLTLLRYADGGWTPGPGRNGGKAMTGRQRSAPRGLWSTASLR